MITILNIIIMEMHYYVKNTINEIEDMYNMKNSNAK